MTSSAIRSVLLSLLAVVSACGPKPKEEAKPTAVAVEPGALLTVGSVTVTQADLDYQLKEKHGGRADEKTRKEALDELSTRARLNQAALDDGIQNDPAVRAEIARVLAGRLKEKNLSPQLKAAASSELSEARLRELYAAGEARFRSGEKRQAAVLWLSPNGNPEREKQYIEKLTAARDWFSQNSDLKAHPDQGFSVLSVDYSEHQASRYKGGVVGWLEKGGGMDAWSKAAAEIVFSLPEPGAVSEVIARPEGVFLVRYMALQPAVLRPFESVADELARTEKQRLRQSVETTFNDTIERKYPVLWLK